MLDKTIAERVTKRQDAILLCLYKHGKLTSPVINNIIGEHVTSVSGSVCALRSKGLVSSSKYDGMGNSYTITEVGTKYIKDKGMEEWSCELAKEDMTKYRTRTRRKVTVREPTVGTGIGDAIAQLSKAAKDNEAYRKLLINIRTDINAVLSGK